MYRDRLNKSKENIKDKENNDKNCLLKTDKKNEQNNSIMSIVKENIEEENKDINKDKNININNNISNINSDKNDVKKEEDPLISHINKQGIISEEDINNSSKLILEEINGNLFNGEKIEINAGGMVGGRGKKDGFTIFGQKDVECGLKSNFSNSEINNLNGENNNHNGIFKPDYELNYAEHLPYPYVFTIYYKKDEKSYYIRAFSGKGSDNKIIFIKLKNDKKFILKQKEIISAGDTIFQITPIKNNFLEIIHLERKKNHHNDSKLVFEGNKNKIITLGRSKDCDFSFPKDKSFSRFQTSFEFDENKKEWSIIDGKDNKGSTNGTWVFGTHSFLIEREMIIEILNSKIQIKEIKNEGNNVIKENNEMKND